MRQYGRAGADDCSIAYADPVDNSRSRTDKRLGANSAAPGNRRVYRDVAEVAYCRFVVDDSSGVNNRAFANVSARSNMSMLADKAPSSITASFPTEAVLATRERNGMVVSV